jgi:hypothetical protein
MTPSKSDAPLAIFTYNRPEHTARLLHSLERNKEFATSPITIYCDGPKAPEHEPAIQKTRQVVRDMAPKRARLVMRDGNFGLAKSIIAGVSEQVAEHGRVVVIEDDLVFSPAALGFLNLGLNRYAEAERVMHVSAYMYPVPRLPDTPFFCGEATCWGWATWDRAWAHFNPDAGALLAEIDRRDARRDFNIRGSFYFYQMLKLQSDGKLDSWAIRWYASMFVRDGLSLHPNRSYVENLGFDGTGVHCKVDDRFIVTTTNRLPQSWPKEIARNEEAIDAMVAYRNKAQHWQSRLTRRVTHALNRINPFT